MREKRPQVAIVELQEVQATWRLVRLEMIRQEHSAELYLAAGEQRAQATLLSATLQRVGLARQA